MRAGNFIERNRFLFVPFITAGALLTAVFAGNLAAPLIDLGIWLRGVISDLFEGKTIGFALSLADMDSENSKDSSGILRPDNWLELFGPDAAGQRYTDESHLWATGILLGADGAGDSAVESFTWGRIKASLAE